MGGGQRRGADGDRDFWRKTDCAAGQEG